MLLGNLRPGWALGICSFSAVVSSVIAVEPQPLRESWDYATEMRKVAALFKGKEGVVLHVGDSITYANPYGQWARLGKGHTEEDQAILKWMHAGAEDESDGWYLARFDHPRGGCSYTACGGLRADEVIAGREGKTPPLAEMLKKYQPQIVVVMIGTNDAAGGRKTADYLRDVSKSADSILASNAICILSTIPPYYAAPQRSGDFNDGLRDLAKKQHLPLIDYEREILTRRPEDWNGTLLAKDDAHPTAGIEGITATSKPTEENLRRSGYLLRGWLSVRKIAEVKKNVLDKPAAAP